ncbi:MAG: DUF6120 family protein [Thomasclavelia sp.]
MKDKNAKNRYFKDIKTLLPIKTSKEKEYLKKINKNLDEYSFDNPDSTYDDYVEKFGTAKDMVVAYLDNCNEDYLISKLRIRNILVKAFTIITVLFILVNIYFLYILQENYNLAKEEHITDYETTIIEE